MRESSSHHFGSPAKEAGFLALVHDLLIRCLRLTTLNVVLSQLDELVMTPASISSAPS